MRIKYKKMILFITMGIMGVGMLTISFDKPSLTKNAAIAVGSHQVIPMNDGKKVTSHSISPTSSITPIPEDPKRLKLNDLPEIDTLIQTYYKAMLETDEETLTSILTDASAIDIAVISKKLEYISNFHNIICYTKPGIKEGDYIVYVSYEMEIASIDTYAPSLDFLYLTSVEGQLYIYSGTLTDDIKALRDEYYQTPEVQDLKLSINQALEDACKNDVELKEFFDNITSSIKDMQPSNAPKETEADDANDVE